MILVIGGAGYIGSHTVSKLIKDGQEVVVLDNLSTGFKKLVHKKAKLVVGDFGDEKVLNQLFQEYDINGILHFAALSLVGESNIKVMEYYYNNLIKTKLLLDKMIEHDISNIVFSSTAAVYGNPTQSKITEEHNQLPINTYGETKLSIERMMKWYSKAYNFKYIIFRYFNATGADSDERIGEMHDPETHLVPLVLKALKNNSNTFYINGDDYDTPDGTCIRDFIDVRDLGEAHSLGINALINNEYSNEIFNLGTGEGNSIYDVIKTCEEVTGRKLNYEVRERRSGDPAVLVADVTKVNRAFNWKAKYSLKESIVNSWEFEKTLN